MPKISVITLTYNRPEWLQEAIASIENQTHQDYEHLVYDNGSDDLRVKKVLQEAKTRRPDKFFYAMPGFLPADTIGPHWNLLIGLSRGKYITILDDDNHKHPDFFDKMSWPMDFNDKIDAVTCGWQNIDENGKLVGPSKHVNLETSLPRLFCDNTIDSNALMFRRSVVDKIGMFDPDITTHEDWHFAIRLVRNGGLITHLEDALLEYRVHPQARTHRAGALGAQVNANNIRNTMFTKEEREAARVLTLG
jgi:GT2 family glycosyltransferase